MTATLYGPLPPAGTSPVAAWHTATEWNGTRPYNYGDWVRFGAPADPAPALKRRSEAKFSPSGVEERVTVGQTTGFRGWVLPTLGAAGTEPRHWHCLAQLIGPNYDGQWSGGAAVSLVVRGGRWRVEGPLAAWAVDLGPYVDAKSVHVDLSVVTGETEATGRVTVLALGQTVTVPHPTFWHQYLVWSHGLYRGSGNTAFADGGPQPTYEQGVAWKMLGMGTSYPVVAAAA